MPRRVLIFDLDGTLIDSAPDLLASINLLLAELGRRPLSLPELQRMIGEGAGMLVKRALAATGRAERWRAHTHRFLEIYDGHAAVHTRPFPGIPELLAALRPHARLALCTNKPARPTLALLQALGWDTVFEVVVGGDSLSERKPHPAPLLYILEELGVTQCDALLVGDSPADAGAAQAAGLDFVAVRWGYSRIPVDDMQAIKRVGDVGVLQRYLYTSIVDAPDP